MVEKNLKEIELNAKQDDANSQFKLGCLYYWGNNVPQDHAKAAYYFSKASEHNHYSAQYYLACMYFEGDGVHQSTNKAIILFKQLSEFNYLSDLNYFNIVIHSKEYLRIIKTEDNKEFSNFEDAAKYYESTASLGNTYAQLNLGIMYKNGWYYSCDLDESAKWYEKVLNNNNNAPNCLGEFMCNLAESYAIDKKYEQSLKYYTLAAEQGNPIAQYALGSIYYNGNLNVSRNRKKAIKFLNMAAEQGHKYAIELLKDDKNILYRLLNPIIMDYYNKKINF